MHGQQNIKNPTTNIFHVVVKCSVFSDIVIGVKLCDGVCIFAPVFWAENQVRSAM